SCTNFPFLTGWVYRSVLIHAIQRMLVVHVDIVKKHQFRPMCFTGGYGIINDTWPYVLPYLKAVSEANGEINNGRAFYCLGYLFLFRKICLEYMISRVER